MIVGGDQISGEVRWRQCSSKDFVFFEGKKVEGKKKFTVHPLSFNKTKRTN
jgi:hypothetical protein